MTDFTGLASLLQDAIKNAIEYKEKTVPKFTVNTSLDHELYDYEYDRDYLPIEINVSQTAKPLHVSFVEIPDCILCESEETPETCGGIGMLRFRPKTGELHQNIIMVDATIPANDEPQPCLPIVIWVKPLVSTEIKVSIKIDGLLIQPDAHAARFMMW